MGDPIGDLIKQLVQAAQAGARGPSFCVGRVTRAGFGRLQVTRDSLPLDKEDLYVNPALSWTWTEDHGETSFLRAGDRVVLLTSDDQTYYLVCKAVRP